MSETTLIIFFLGLIAFAGHIFSAVSERFGFPDILLLVLLGIILGPVSGIFNASELGKLGVVFSKIAIVLIIFEAGLELEIKGVLRGIRKIAVFSTLSFVLTFSVIFFIARSFLDLSFDEIFILVFSLIAPAPSVVLPLIKPLSIYSEEKHALIVDSILAEVISVAVVFSFLDVAGGGNFSGSGFLRDIAVDVGGGILLGILGGILWSLLLRVVRQVQYNLFTTLAFALCIYSLSEILGMNGILSVFMFGLVLGNAESVATLSFLRPFDPIKPSQGEITFFSEVIFLIRVFFFVYMGTVITLGGIKPFLIAVFITSAIISIRYVVNAFTLKLDAANIFLPRGIISIVIIMISKEFVDISPVVEEIVYFVVIMTIIWSSSFAFFFERLSRHGELGGERGKD